jgi:hypothetical protein
MIKAGSNNPTKRNDAKMQYSFRVSLIQKKKYDMLMVALSKTKKNLPGA